MKVYWAIVVDGCKTTCTIEPRSWRGVRDTILCDTICQWLATGQ